MADGVVCTSSSQGLRPGAGVCGELERETKIGEQECPSRSCFFFLPGSFCFSLEKAVDKLWPSRGQAGWQWSQVSGSDHSSVAEDSEDSEDSAIGLCCIVFTIFGCLVCFFESVEGSGLCPSRRRPPPHRSIRTPFGRVRCGIRTTCRTAPSLAQLQVLISNLPGQTWWQREKKKERKKSSQPHPSGTSFMGPTIIGHPEVLGASHDPAFAVTDSKLGAPGEQF